MFRNRFARFYKFLGERNPLTKAIARLSSGVVAAQVIALVVYPLLTRIYSAEAFGLLGVYTAMVGLVVMVSTLRYDMAVPLADSRQNGLSVVSVALYCNLAIAVLFLVIGALAPEMLRVLGRGEFPSYFVWLVPMGILLGGTYKTWRMWAVREKSYGTIATTNVTQTLATSLAQVGLGIVHPAGISLVSSNMLGSGAGTWTIIKRTARGRGLRIPKLKETLAAGRSYWRFAAMGAPSALLNSIAINSPSILMASFHGVAAAGFFSLAMRVIGVPGTLIGSSVETAFYAEAARLGRGKGVEIQQMVRRLTKHLVMIGAVPTVVLALLGPTLFAFIFGGEWREAGVYASFLSIFMFFNMLSMPFSSIFLIFEKLHLSLVLNALKAILAAGSFIVPHALGYGPTITMLIYALTLGFFYLVFGVSARVTLSREIKKQICKEIEGQQ